MAEEVRSLKNEILEDLKQICESNMFFKNHKNKGTLNANLEKDIDFVREVRDLFIRRESNSNNFMIFKTFELDHRFLFAIQSIFVSHFIVLIQCEIETKE